MMTIFTHEVLNKFSDLPKPDAVFLIQNVADYLSMFKVVEIDASRVKHLYDETFEDDVKEGEGLVFGYKIQDFYVPEIPIKLPFKNVYMEYEGMHPYNYMRYFISIHIIETSKALICDVYLGLFGMIFLLGGVGVEKNDKEACESIYFIEYKSKEREVPKIFDKNFIYKKDLTVAIVGNAVFAVQLLNCKNISCEEFSHKLNRAARRRGEKEYFEKYYVLEIDPIKKILKEEGKIHVTGIKHALHLCRGHFRTYGEDGKLFGKVEGTFWIPAHKRGSADVGIIKKDYKILSPEEKEGG